MFSQPLSLPLSVSADTTVPEVPAHSVEKSVYTTEQQHRLRIIAKEASERFPTDKTRYYDSALDVKNAIQTGIGDKYGFKVSLQGSSVICSKHDLGRGYDNRQQKRGELVPEECKRQRQPNRCKCGFEVKFSVMGKISRNRLQQQQRLCVLQDWSLTLHASES